MDLVTTFCDSHVSVETRREAELEARGAWRPALDARRGYRVVRSPRALAERARSGASSERVGHVYLTVAAPGGRPRLLRP